jgi:iron complex outermembrane receptor protein
MLNTSLPYNFRMSFNISYQDREGSFVTYSESGYINTLYKPVWLADMHIKYQYRNVLLFTGATNILNITYSDAGSLHQPGRWFSGGINFKLQ